MKRASSLILALVVGTILSALPVYAQAPAMPDYSQWEKISEVSVPVIHNGKRTELRGELYMYDDVVNLKRYTVVIFYNQNNEPWFSLVTEETSEKNADSQIYITGTNRYIFENNGKWTLAKDLTDSTNLERETKDFLKSKYNLEL